MVETLGRKLGKTEKDSLLAQYEDDNLLNEIRVIKTDNPQLSEQQIVTELNNRIIENAMGLGQKAEIIPESVQDIADDAYEAGESGMEMPEIPTNIRPEYIKTIQAGYNVGKFIRERANAGRVSQGTGQTGKGIQKEGAVGQVSFKEGEAPSSNKLLVPPSQERQGIGLTIDQHPVYQELVTALADVKEPNALIGEMATQAVIIAQKTGNRAEYFASKIKERFPDEWTKIKPAIGELHDFAMQKLGEQQKPKAISPTAALEKSFNKLVAAKIAAKQAKKKLIEERRAKREKEKKIAKREAKQAAKQAEEEAKRAAKQAEEETIFKDVIERLEGGRKSKAVATKFDFEKTKGEVTPEDYRKLFTIKPQKQQGPIGKIAKRFTGGISSAITPISYRLGKICPELKQRVIDWNFDKKRTVDKWADKAEKFNAQLKRIPQKERAIFDYALLNGDLDTAESVAKKYKLPDWIKDARELVDVAREEMNQYGTDIGKIENYFPRKVKDYEGLIKHIGGTPLEGVLSRAIKKVANDKGISALSLSEEQKADIVTSVINRNMHMAKTTPGSSKSRVFQKIPPELAQYYHDSGSALYMHLVEAGNIIATRKFLGRTEKGQRELQLKYNQSRVKVAKLSIEVRSATDPNVKKKKALEYNIALQKRKLNRNNLERYKVLTDEDVADSIGTTIINLITDKKLKIEDEKEATRILKTLLNPGVMGETTRWFKNLTFLSLLSNPITTLSQLQDFVFVLLETDSFWQMAKTVGHTGGRLVGVHKPKVTIKDLGLGDRPTVEMDTAGGLTRKLVDKTLFLLNKFDEFGKQNLIDAAYEKYTSRAKENPQALQEELLPLFVDDAEGIVGDLKAGKISEGVVRLLFNRVTHYHPVTNADMPVLYSEMKNGKIFYTLKSFTIKQLSVVRAEVFDNIAKGMSEKNAKKVRHGVRQLMVLMGFMATAGVGVDMLKDWLLGRETDYSDYAVDNLLKIIGLSKYFAWVARYGGLGEAAAKIIAPPLAPWESISKDIFEILLGDDKEGEPQKIETIKHIPMIGKLIYWHFGYGVKKREDLLVRRFNKRYKELEAIKQAVEESSNHAEMYRKYRRELIELENLRSVKRQLTQMKKSMNEMKKLNPYNPRIEFLNQRRLKLIGKHL